MAVKVVVGIDTSNYTTSCAICDMDGVIVENYKVLLPVKDGENGLRQSDAVFAHVKNFQTISEKIKEKHADYEIVAVGYSAYPRDAEGSYMPCFLVGKAVAEMISALYGIPSVACSHQAGHIQAAIYSSGFVPVGKFIAFHVSGGTTEILLVNPKDKGFDIEIVGSSVDLHAGQAIDRIGVMMGMKFPCGKAIEDSAMNNKNKIPPVKTCVRGYSCNLSGLENLATRLFLETKNVSLVSAYTLEFISKTITEITENLRRDYPDASIVYAGGVMSNRIIQNNLRKRFAKVYFAEPQFSADNAAGVSLITRKNLI